MKSKHHIILETNHVRYEFDIKRNITIIQGDSATGKTTLVGLLQEYGVRGEASGIRLQSDAPCVVFSGASETWQYTLGAVHGSIVFIDEGYRFIYTRQFAAMLDGSDNYYVLISRKPLRNLPYSVREIYGIRTTGRYHFPEKAYHEFYPIHDNDVSGAGKDNLVVMVEDGKSGYQFYSKVLHTKCIPADGNSNIYQKLRDLGSDYNAVVIADGAAFGAYIDEILELRELNNNIAMYLPESFEWVILKSGTVGSENLDDVLEHPEDYIDSSRYLSWERFFTDYLKSITKDDALRHYRKSKLAEYYLKGKAREGILSVLPEELRAILL